MKQIMLFHIVKYSSYSESKILKKLDNVLFLHSQSTSLFGINI